MKAVASFLLILLFAVSARAGQPALGIAQAVAIAEKSLQERGLAGDYHIVSAALEAATITRSKFHWTIRWSALIPRDENKKEIGLEIAMDGSVTRLIKGPARGR